MSIERSSSSLNHDSATREVDRPRDRPRDEPREKPKAEQVDRFRTLMQARGEGKEQKLEQRLELKEGKHGALAGGRAEGQDRAQTATDQAVGRKDAGEEGAGHHGGGDTLQPAELAALYQAQVVTREVPAAIPTAAPVAHANPQALADMLERHVRQLAVSADGVSATEGQVLLRLKDATLPGTDLLLSRTETGWLLKADVRSRSSYDAIQQAAPQLAERFATRRLGVLTIDSQYTG